jgi:hypothetical protein
VTVAPERTRVLADYGAVRRRRGVVWTVFGVCALPSLSFVGRAIYLLVRWLRPS